MKNDEKIDIQLDDKVSEDMNALEKAKRHYDTGHRYIELSRLMKKYEDRDLYFHRGIRYIKKCHPVMDVHAELKKLRLELFEMRSQGRVDLYEKAMEVLNTAKYEKDYKTAIELFRRIYDHEKTHSIPENLVDPALYAKVKEYSDSEEKIQYCEQQIESLNARGKRKTKIFSATILCAMVLLLIFSKTLRFHELLGDIFSTVHAYSFAYQRYEYVKDNTQDSREQSRLQDLSSECHYRAAQKAIDAHNKDLAFDEYSICVERDYKDSAQKLYELELQKIDSTDVGKYVRYGGKGRILWKILAKDGNKALLYKKFGLDEKPMPSFHTENVPVTWENCSLRGWLNDTYMNREFTDIEKNAIAKVTVPADNNSVYGTSGGKDTQDQIYILSVSEYNNYIDLLPETESAWWTRTPGATPNTMVIINRYKTIMDYGYEVSSNHFTIKPVLWVEYK